MTNAKLIQSFKLDYDKIDSFSAPELSDTEIDYYLNKGMYELIEDCEAKGVESSTTITDYLDSIVVPYSTTELIAGNYDNSYLAPIPDDYRTTLLERVEVSYLDCNNNTVTSKHKVKAISRDFYEQIIEDPFNIPWKKQSFRITGQPLRATKRVEIITGIGITPITYYLDYIKNPTPIDSTISQECELSEKAQLKIIEIAVKLAKFALQPQTLQEEIIHQKTKEQFIN